MVKGLKENRIHGEGAEGKTELLVKELKEKQN